MEDRSIRSSSSSNSNATTRRKSRGCWGRLKQKYSELRWMLVGRHFHRRVLELLQDLQFITFGQILLTIPLIVCLVGGLITIFVSPNTTQSGNYAFYCLMLTYLFANKSTSIFSLVFGLSWTQLVVHHHLSTIFALLITVGHAYVAFTGQDYIQPKECYEEEEGGGVALRRQLYCLEYNPKYRFSQIGPKPDLWAFLWDGGRNTSGSYMTVCLLALIGLSSIRWFRKHAYDLWLVLHICFAGALLAYADKHRIGMLVFVIILWWGLDGVVRYGYGMLCVNPKKATLTKILPDVVEISFPRRNFSFHAGQFVRIAFPYSKHPVMFHPLTISSAPYQETTTLHFRAVGGWTRYLADLCPDEKDTSDIDKKKASNSVDVNILVEGPFGALTMDLWDNHERYPVVVLICGGIGVAPMLSLARQLLYEHEREGKKRRKVQIVWAVRDLALPRALMPLLALPQALKPLLLLADPYDDDGIDDGNNNTSSSSNMLGAPKSRAAKVFPRGDGHGNSTEEESVNSAFCCESVEGSSTMGFEVWHKPSHEQQRISNTKNTVKPVSPSSLASRPSVFCGDIYLTDTNIPSAMEDTISSNNVTWSLCHDEGFTVHSGCRPDVHSILAAASAEATAYSATVAVTHDNGNVNAIKVKEEQRIAVVACGPPSLIRDAKIACVSHTRPGVVELDFHEEVFLF